MPGRHGNTFCCRAKDDIAYHLLGTFKSGINCFNKFELLKMGLSFIKFFFDVDISSVLCLQKFPLPGEKIVHSEMLK